jgi:3-dehydrotetronate 4-kinase
MRVRVASPVERPSREAASFHSSRTPPFAVTRLRLGCIADDFTGATDLANNLVRSGMRVVQTIGVPARPADADVDAVVVALKTRTIPSAEAVARSLDALQWLRSQGAGQIYFKYCSTFDSTPEGNIGPVTEALMDALVDLPGADFAIATPAFPDNQRTVFKGHLFVGDVLLNESGMQHHPLTPMTDANLVRVLQAQCRRKVGLVDYRVVARGMEAIRARFDALRAQGIGIAIVDAISNDDLLRLGPALKGMPLVTAGSGVATALPANFGIAPSNAASALPVAGGAKAAIAGSCSQATRRQVRAFLDAGGAAFGIDPLEIAAGVDVAKRALAWCAPQLGRDPVLIYSTADPATVKSVQERLGVEQAGTMIERTLAAIARGLVARGVRQLVVAGGETAGACVQALHVTQMQIGPQIDPGVPWCHAQTDSEPIAALHLALKSGNFGGDDFFTRAFSLLA